MLLQLNASVFRDFILHRSGCQKRHVTAHSGTHPMLEVLQKTCGNVAAPQKRDFPIPRLFILLTQGHVGCSTQQKTKGKHLSRRPDSSFSVRPPAPLAHISQGLMRTCQTSHSASPFPPPWFPPVCSSRRHEPEAVSNSSYGHLLSLITF